MRLLVDECLAARVAELLVNHGHDAIHVADLGLLGQPDTAIMAAARTTGRVVVSADTDFGELLHITRAASPSVILLRRRNHDPQSTSTTISPPVPSS